MIAASQQQRDELNAFVARPVLPSALAAAPRDPKEEEEAATAQCTVSAGAAGTVSGSASATLLPMSVIRPPFDWWR